MPGVADRRVGEILLGEPVRELSARAAGMLEGAFSEETSSWLVETYRPEETFGTAFAKLMTRIFAGRGLIFLDPLAPELHRVAAPAMVRAVREHAVLGKELVERSAALERAGYHAQVKVSEQSTLLFRIVNGQRLALRSSNGGLVAGDQKESADETLRAIEDHPEQFSPSALLRPVIQDTLLPTAAYIAGPAGIAYHTQTSLIYLADCWGARLRFCLAQASLLVPAHISNLLKKYNLDVREVFAGRRHLRAKMEAEALPQALTSRFDEGRKRN